MSTKYPEQRSSRHASPGRSAQPSGDEVYHGGGPAGDFGRQTPAFPGTRPRQPRSSTEASRPASGGSMWAVALGTFGLATLAGYLLWRR